MRSRQVSASVAMVVLGVCTGALGGVQADLCTFRVRQATLFFSNGVGNTLQNAQTSAREARYALASDLQSAELIDTNWAGTLYHHNDGLPQDVAETLLQKARDETRSPDIVWDNIVALSRGLSAPGILLAQMLAAVTSFDIDQLKQKALAQVEKESYDDGLQLREFLEADPKARALVVGHSQGTLYANGVYDSISRSSPDEMAKRVRVVNVGAAAAKVSGQADPSTPEQYVTSYVDGVILGLRSISASAGLAAPLPANIGAHFVTSTPGAAGILGFNTDAIQNHGFVSTYLYDATSRYPLRTLLRNVLLEWVDVDSASVQSGVEIEYVVDSQRGSTYYRFSDSTNIGPATPLGPQIAAWPLPGVFYGMPIQNSGLKLYSAKVGEFLHCNYVTRLNFRPDSPGSALTLNPANGVLALNIVRNPDEPATLVSMRYRLTSTDDGSPSPWETADVQNFSLAPGSTTIPVFAYSSVLRPTGLRLSIN